MSERWAIRGARLLPMDGRRVVKRTDLVVGAGRIAALARVGASPGQRVEDTEAIVMPGFVVAHASLDQAVLDRGFVPSADPRRLSAQLRAVTAGQSPDELELGARIAIARGLASGATAWVDAGRSTDRDAAIRSALALGVRLVAPIDALKPDAPAVLDRLRETFGAAIDGGQLLLALWVGDAEDAAPGLLRRAAQLARAGNLSVLAWLGRLPRWGASGLRRLAGAGLLGERTILIHGRHRTLAGQARRLAEARVGVVVTPSADVLAGAPSPALRPLLDTGVEVGLGLGGNWSRHGHDVFRELRLLRRMLAAEEHAAPASAALELATRGVCRGLGLPAGQLEVGLGADVIIVDVPGPQGEDHEVLATRLIEQARPSDVRRAFVAGTRVMSDGLAELVGAPGAEEEQALRQTLLGRAVLPASEETVPRLWRTLLGPRWPRRAPVG